MSAGGQVDGGLGGLTPEELEAGPARSGFDAAQVAQVAREHGDDELGSVIGQLVGYASTCWESLSGTGVFESDRARAALDSTLAWLRSHGAQGGVDRGEHPTVGEVMVGQRCDWRDDGLLWLVNASVFHPRGFALGVNRSDPSALVLLGDGSEPWSFDPDDDPTPRSLAAAAEALFARARAAAGAPSGAVEAGPGRDFVDVVMKVAPHANGEFIETEDAEGHSIGENRGLQWIAPAGDDPYWRLRIPVRR